MGMETTGAKWRASEVYLRRDRKASGKKRRRSGGGARRGTGMYGCFIAVVAVCH